MTKTKKPPRKEEPTTDVLNDPKWVHELLSLLGHYDPPPMPIPTKGYVTWWDAGISINELRRRKREPLPGADWLDGARFAKDSDSWRWRELNLTPIGLGETFVEQAKKLSKGYEPPTAREVVTFLIVRFLATGERPDILRLRTKDVMPSGRRVVVGPFEDHSIEIANVSDRWTSPGIALCSAFTPVSPGKSERQAPTLWWGAALRSKRIRPNHSRAILGGLVRNLVRRQSIVSLCK